MKKLEHLALLLVILLMLTHFLSLFGTALIVRVYGREFMSASNAELKLITTARSLLSIIVNVIVGIWLFIQARQSGGTAWIWLLFGMVYGLVAVVLFFLLRVYERKSQEGATLPAADEAVDRGVN